MADVASYVDLDAFLQRSAARFQITVATMYGDLDPNRHINHARYLAYLEECRLAFRRELAATESASISYSWPVAELTIRYIKPLFYPQKVTIELAPIVVGRTSYTLGYGIYSDDHCRAVAMSRTVRIENATGKPVAIPDALAERLKQLLTSVER